MVQRNALGIGSVLSEIGLLSSSDDFKVTEKRLIQGLCERFELDQKEAKRLVSLTLAFGAIVRKKEKGVFVIYSRGK